MSARFFAGARAGLVTPLTPTLSPLRGEGVAGVPARAATVSFQPRRRRVSLSPQRGEGRGEGCGCLALPSFNHHHSPATHCFTIAIASTLGQSFHMEHTDSLDELLICRLDLGRKVIEPCSIVIFGASGDLTYRKLIPALYHLMVDKQLPDPIRIIGVARREKSDEAWREELKAALQQFSRTKKVDPEQWDAFSANIHYCQG